MILKHMDLKGKKILVTGGHGFLGSWVVDALVARGVPRADISVPNSKELDLVRWENCVKAVVSQQIVIHLAARVGGIGANQAHPGKFFYENSMMGIQLMEAARLAGVEKFVAFGTVCAYPKAPKVPFKEDDLWDGYPEPVTAPYGLAKKMTLVQAEAYKKEYGFNSIYLVPTNIYGPRDHFDPASSHVAAALIRKAVEAEEHREPYLDVWGTGKATRDFLFVKDAAEGIVQATERFEKTEPANLGSGREVSIKELAETICRLVGFKGELRWDATKPDGQPRRCLDISRARREFGFAPKIGLEAGLKETIEWYYKTYNE
jgi:GDP-L-fucose synthase